MSACTPRVGVGAAFPHYLEISCWEHGLIARLDYTATVAEIVQHTERHRTEQGEQTADEQIVEWGTEVQRDCEVFGNSLHSRINGVIQRVDPATWMIRIAEGER